MTGTVQIIYRPEDGTGEQLLYPVEEAARRLRKARRTVDRYIATGQLSSRRILGHVCIPADEVDALALKGATS